MFEPSPAPRVFALPPGSDFARVLAEGVLHRLAGQPPEALAKVQIYVNTRRSARLLETLFAREGARLLPDIRVLGDLGAMPLPHIPPALPALRRKLVLAQLVDAFLRREPEVAPQSAVFDLADSLGSLLDVFAGEGVPLSALREIEVERASGHWERALRFLDILADYWDNHRPDGALDGEARQRAVVEHLATRWQASPPQYPVIVAGSTGSRGHTALFMQVVADLPQGAVVLPGYDTGLPENAWQALGEDHPQYGFRALGEKLGFAHPVPLWQAAPAPSPARNRLLSLALRPAPVTDQWLAEGPGLTRGIPDACARATLLEAPNPRAEAEAIAVRLRLAAEAGQKAALVTPDRVLARRVAAALQRWDITPDDSAGQPLPLTPPGIFLRRVLALAGGPLVPADLLALLKHPLCGGTGEARHLHRQMVQALETGLLRGGPAFVTLTDLHRWASGDTEGNAKGDEARRNWVDALWQALAPLQQLDTATRRPLAEWLALHLDAAEALAGAGALWDKAAGQAALAQCNALRDEAPYAADMDLLQYRALFRATLAGGEVREAAFLPHPDIAILGTLEARMQSADLVILGGLNEGLWPNLPPPDPWMSRDMLQQANLPLPERRIGLSAHDFQQAAAASEVVFSRALRDGESPTVASRWLIRLLNLLDGLGATGTCALEAMRARGQTLLQQAETLNRPARSEPRAPRPAPAPPVSARPETLSVTRVETLIRDPYVIYAQKVLGLYPLDPPGRQPDALERGTVLHRIAEVFVDRTLDGLPDTDAAAEALFIDIAQTVLAGVPWPATRRFWIVRMQALAAEFIKGERARRDGAQPLRREVKGARKLHAPRFTLTAKADRIDLLAGGTLAIYDYKSGTTLPSDKQVKLFAKQLPLEAAIAEAGGFEGIAPAKVSKLGYISLSKKGNTRELPLADDSSDSETVSVTDIWEGLQKLVARYAQPALGYAARLRPELLSYASGYEHLSRFGEWQDGDLATVLPVGPDATAQEGGADAPR